MSYRAKTTKACERQLQGCLHKIEKWCIENGFKFSQSKTVCVHFHKKRGILDAPDLNFKPTVDQGCEENEVSRCNF